MHRVTAIFNRIVFTVFALSLAGMVAAKSELSPAIVGEITFVLGKATIQGADGHSVRAVVGLPIHVSDTIETAGSGQVNIHFVDDALASVRPLSTLEVVRYDYNPQNPQNSAVKFALHEGIFREISGEAAKQARQNFRLNTPIAAIGVRGTDFAVSANSQSVRAIVNEGAIVVAPFSSQCSAAGFGPCSQNAKELTGLSHQILEMSAGTAGISSALLPATNAQALALVAEVSAKADSSNKTVKTTGDAKDLYTDTVTSRAVNTTLATSESVKPVETPLPPPVVVVVVPPPTPEFTPAVAQSTAALTSNTQLVWGRYSNINPDNERITVLYNVDAAAVAAQGDYQVTVGNFKYALFRKEIPGQTMQFQSGVVGFDLNKAQAQFTSGGQVSLMQVSGGKLTLDFNQAMFSTSLQLSSAATGSITFADSGHIYDANVFVNSSATQSMGGTISLDGKEAGYLFQKTLSNGSVDGLTLWSRKP